MDSADYIVVYDIVERAYAPSWLFIFVFVGCAVTLARDLNRPTHPIVSVIAVLGMVTIGGTMWWSMHRHAEMRQSFLHGRYSVVEGEVTSFRNGRPDCGERRFAVNDRNFRFSWCDGVTGFNAAGIDDLSGACVKMALVDVPGLGRQGVAWFAVRRGGCPPAPQRP